jgi:WD40 repeat protein
VHGLWRKVAIVVLLTRTAIAGELPTVPILKVEVGTHTAMIRRLVLDEARDRVVTGGDDKTVRLWDLRTGELIRTVHLPIGPAHEGQINGLAISADGRIIAAGGRTGWDLDGRAWLYLIDSQSGQFIGRIDDLPEIICYLAYSRTGEYLAVGLCRDKGLRLYRTSDRALIFSDTDFRDRIAGMDFASDGRLAATSYGGDVRVYSPAFQVMAHTHLDDGAQPTIVRFSPDGRTLAIGYLDSAVVTLMQAANLQVTGRRRPQAAKGPSDLPGVAWSADGRYVYAIGGSSWTDNFIWRFSASADSAGEPLGGVHGRWTALEAAADGSLVYAAEDPVPVWGRLAGTGARVFQRRPPTQDFANLCGRLEIADDFAVRFVPALSAARRLTFAPRQDYFGSADAPSLAAEHYQTSPTTAPGLRTQGWDGATAPRVNDRPLKLDPYEIARCVAVDPTRQRLAMGSEWTLRLFNSDAVMIWAIPLSQVVRTVGFTPDGRYVVAGLSDGTLRWYRSSDGMEIVAALLHSDSKNWIAWTPDGFYDSSLEGDSLIGWHVNRGRDHAADFFRAVQFERLLYVPDAVRGAYQEASPRPQALAGLAFTPSALIPILPPVIEARASDAGGGRGLLDLDAEFRGGPMQRLQVFVNGIPALPVADQALTIPNTGTLHRRLDVPIAAGPNEIRVEIATPSAIGVGGAQLTGSGGGGLRSADLYILAIGANRFDDSNMFRTLNFAVADAAGMIAASQRAEGNTYRHVHALEVSDDTGGVSARRVTEALRFLEGAGQGDTVVLFLASHGISDAHGNYYFVPSDATRNDAEKALEGADTVSLIRWSTFFDVLRRLPGRRIVIVDTCKSGYFGGSFDVTSLAKRSFTSHFALVAASSGKEDSHEYPAGGHGLFTYGLLQSLSHPAPSRGANTLDVVFQHASRFVAQHVDTAAGTQTPQLIAPPPLGATILTP